MRRPSSDQQAAVFVGNEIVIAFLRGQIPQLSQQWEWVANPGFYNEEQKRMLKALTHPDATVVRRVQAIATELEGVERFIPGLSTAHVYLTKP